MKPSVYEPALYLEQPILWVAGTSEQGAAFAEGLGSNANVTPSAGFTTQFRRKRFTSIALTANLELGVRLAYAEDRSAWRGNAAKLGGFYFSSRFMVNAIPDGAIRFFCGLTALTGSGVCQSNTPPANTVGLWCDDTDNGNLTILNVDSGGVAEKMPLQSGHSQTLTAGTLYEFVMIANPSPSGSPGLIVTNLINVGTGALLASQNPGNRLPASTAFMGPQVGLSNAAHTAGGDCSLDILSIYLRTNLRLTPLGTP